MTALAKKLYDQAMTLEERERLKLARDILASVEDEDDGEDADAEEAWNKEIERRIAEIDSGKVKGMDAFKALKALKARCK